jgi:hypothetical protein
MAKKKAKDVDIKPNIPLNELPGRCRQCAGASFKLMYFDHVMVRECQNPDCGQWFNVETMKPWGENENGI